MEPDVRVNKWESSIPHDVIKINAGAVTLQEILGLELMALGLVNDGFEPMKAIVAKEWNDEVRFHRLYLMAGIKRELVAHKGYFHFGDRKVTYHAGWGVEQVKERCICDKEIENKQLQTI